MPDLVQKYFQEDLTAEEQQTLESLLENSEDAAWKFGKAAEKAYYRYGLSKPHWPHSSGPSAGPKLWFKLWFGLSILVLGSAMAWLFWKHFPILNLGIFKHSQVSTGSSTPVHAGKSTVHSGSVDKAKEELKTVGKTDFAPPTSRDEAAKLPDHSVSSLQTVTLMAASANVPASSGVQPMVTPINLEEASSKTFSSLSLRINQSEMGYVTVQVLDMRGVVVCPVYQGYLAAGQWLFEWDGKLRNGQKATRGFYQIEVKSGSYSRRRNIEIR